MDRHQAAPGPRRTRLHAKAAPAADKGVKCSGINSCKGQGACAGAGHGCAGKNSCKGTGWSYTKSEKECTDKGGKVVAAAKK